MAVTVTFYNSYKKKLMDGSNIDLDTDTIKISAHTDSETPDIDADDFWDDVSATEISATGYTSGGATLANPAVTADNTDNEGVFDADNVTWTLTTSVSVRYFIIYKDTGTDSTSPLIGYIDAGETLGVSNSTLTLSFSAEGIININ